MVSEKEVDVALIYHARIVSSEERRAALKVQEDE